MNTFISEKQALEGNGQWDNVRPFVLAKAPILEQETRAAVFGGASHTKVRLSNCPSMTIGNSLRWQ